MEKLPSLLTTYERVFNLYFRTFIEVLPILLIMAAIQYGANYYIETLGEENPMVLAVELAMLLVSMLFYACLIAYIYGKHHGQAIGLFQALGQGSSRFLPYLLSLIILMLPFVLIALLLAVPSIVGPMLEPNTGKWIAVILYFITAVLAIVYVLYLLYFFVVGVHIVSERQGAIAGIKSSLRITKGHWLSTFLLVLVYFLFAFIIAFLMAFVINALIMQAIVTVLFSSFLVSLIVIHHDHLTKASAPVTATPVTTS